MMPPPSINSYLPLRLTPTYYVHSQQWCLPWLMDASVDTVDGDIVLNFKKFLVEEGGDEISICGPQNFIYLFADTVDEGHGS